MGVKGLKSFIESNDNLLYKNFKLHNSTLVIDAQNLQGTFIRSYQGDERADLFGSNLVAYANHIDDFLDNLHSCNITPIFVFDGAQTSSVNTSKSKKKYERALKIFRNTQKIKDGFVGDYLVPLLATTTFKAILNENEVKIVQCMFEADLEIARIANEYQCPVLSNDSDFFLVELIGGLISIDSFDHDSPVALRNGQSAIRCNIFYQEKLKKYFPDLDSDVLPIVGILAGNDFVDESKFRNFCSQLPIRYICELYGVKPKRFSNLVFKKHEKLIKILYFICGKSLPQIVNQICNKFPTAARKDLKLYIQNQLKAYKIPDRDTFYDDISAYMKKINCNIADSKQLKQYAMSVAQHLRESAEKSVMPARIFEVLQGNTIYLKCPLSDPSFSSPHSCAYNQLGVLLQILRVEDRAKKVHFFDTVKYKYCKFFLNPVTELKEFGSLESILIIDIPYMDEKLALNLLLATFSCDPREFQFTVDNYKSVFGDQAMEICILKGLFDFIDSETDVKLWHRFKMAVIVCYLLHEEFSDPYIEKINNIVETKNLECAPFVRKRHNINVRIIHQISQLQVSIFSYNSLCALLNEPNDLVNPQNWFNSCLIYNLTNLLQSNEYLRDCPNYIEIQTENVFTPSYDNYHEYYD